MTDPLRNLAPGATFKLPSVEQMRREVESGEFSPESIEVADAILKNSESIEDAVDDIPVTEDYWFEQRYQDARYAEDDDDYMGRTNAELRQMAIDAEESEKAARKPNLKELSKHFVKQLEPIQKSMGELGKSAQKVTKAFRKISQPKPVVRVGANLQYRPFHGPLMMVLRDELSRNA